MQKIKNSYKILQALKKLVRGGGQLIQTSPGTHAKFNYLFYKQKTYKMLGKMGGVTKDIIRCKIYYLFYKQKTYNSCKMLEKMRGGISYRMH